MQIRWMRREKRVAEGLALVCARYLKRDSISDDAAGFLVGLQELKLREETDKFWLELAPETKQFPQVQFAYMRNLLDQERYLEAAEIAKRLAGTSHQQADDHPSVQKALYFGEVCKLLARSGVESAPALLADAFVSRTIQTELSGKIGTLAMFSSQLGAGGAERQFVRIAAALNQLADVGQVDARYGLVGPLQLAIHHSDPSVGKDFFLPYLTDAGLDVAVLDNMREPEVQNPFEEMGPTGGVFHLLPKKVRKGVRRLAAKYRADRPDTAYIWQDTGMHVAALAALAAGVPRIVLCFRSTPLKIRKDFFKPSFEGYFERLVRVPGVCVACNSRIMAQKYADWLGISADAVLVIPNAATALASCGDDDEASAWRSICDASQGCSKTVLGVFRLHPVKRGSLWIEVAERYIKRDQHTRFVIVGAGDEHQRLQALIDEKGLGNRVFLAGRRKAVGFWLEKADVVLHCARHEGLPNAILEAQLAERPVIATPAGGTREALLHGQSGICLSAVEPFPYDEALEALETLLSDPAKRATFGSRGSDFVRDNFSMDASLKLTLNLLASPITGAAE
ncbi:glycosyltransferase [Cognatiyoonia sp. IB215182]|uniref:glycosyltransferase n=1 Tax=Cognatiyoonia sp. IB215182 TaxID=3097353 RepID=UPI002A0CD166|nr:glycosyltransferase [Cognatiyoonia sp. IB215182]MDX8354314.1 glycosyltransferase [Cognatiyoonia sp. IB215182]